MRRVSTNNYDWVCFSCCYAKREAKQSKNIPLCQECKAEMICVGYKIEIPKRSSKKEWRDFKESYLYYEAEKLVESQKQEVRAKHRMEKEIKRVEALADNKMNRKNLKRLKEAYVCCYGIERMKDNKELK